MERDRECDSRFDFERVRVRERESRFTERERVRERVCDFDFDLDISRDLLHIKKQNRNIFISDVINIQFCYRLATLT